MFKNWKEKISKIQNKEIELKKEKKRINCAKRKQR